MIKTIDTAVATKAMIELLENHYGSSRLSFFKTILAILEAAPAVEPAQAEQSEESGDLMWMTAKMRDRERNRIGKIVDGLEQIKQEKLAAINAADDEPAQSVAESVSKEWDSLGSIGNRLHSISVEQHYAGNEKLSDELGEFASLLWIWDRTRKPTVPPAIVEPAQAVPVAHMRVMVGCRAPDDCEEYLDVCNPDDVGIDGKAFPVYKVPPAIERKPLTDEQICEIAKPFLSLMGDHWNFSEGIQSSEIENFSRAIERAHGILEAGND